MATATSASVRAIPGRVRSRRATAGATAAALLLTAGCAAEPGPPVLRILPDTGLDSPADAPPPDRPSNLQRALEGLEGPVRIVLGPGRYHLHPTDFVDPTCGNCADPDEAVPATLGARISGERIEIVGATAGDSVVIHTHAGYGLLFEDCDGCVLRNVTVTGTARDPDGRATSGAVLVRRSRVRIEDCMIRDNIGDAAIVRETVAGVAGIVGREGADLHIEMCAVQRNSWDGIVLYRDARAVIRDNVVDGIDAAAGSAVGGGRGVGIGLTWNARATIEGNLVRNYWKGIGMFVDAQADVRHNIVEDILTWGIAYWAAGDGRPAARINANAVFRTGACGVMIAGAEDPGDTAPGSFAGNALVRTAGDPRYDDGTPYCLQRPIARATVPPGFVLQDNLLHENRQPGDAHRDPQLDRAAFAQAILRLIDELGRYVALAGSAFLAEFGEAGDGAGGGARLDN